MKVRLEINQLNIERPKRRWKLYFVVIAEHPTDPDKMVLSTLPSNPIKVTPNQQNEIHFDDNGPGSEGLLLLRRNMPPSKELNVHFYVRHSRSAVRNAVSVLQDIENEMGGEALQTVDGMLDTENPWLVITKKSLPLVGKVLARVPDRDMGFISMFERFGDEFFADGEIDRKKTGAFCNVVYTWSLDTIENNTN
ncbi:hypothetical protein [Flavobacterium sedimenticola]|uniref:Uncharacterized protein n=1 Tax=Flavobacterium sedimenticola TaxID=3043286 RepID=A0ABT6XT85_9FLAO|nr:hypothetical protein [Flavobacterium sedimenticola]MDI9258308.1 hypothetical protein [Flavobacterium sedimenticola]